MGERSIIMTELPSITRDELELSFEFFPNKDSVSSDIPSASWKAIARLASLEPNYVSITYGAGGSTQHNTEKLIQRILNDTSLIPAAHLTCVGASKNEIDGIIRGYYAMGVRRIVALRGDPPAGKDIYEAHPEGYAHAVDLVQGIKSISEEFTVSVSAYPEKHPESLSVEQDIIYLKDKQDAGASQAITQFFFDNQYYYRFLDQAQNKGVTMPITPGILPIVNFSRAIEFAHKCGTSVPKWLHEAHQKAEANPDSASELAFEIVYNQCRDLIDNGVRTMHIYTLNNAPLTEKLCKMLIGK